MVGAAHSPSKTGVNALVWPPAVQGGHKGRPYALRLQQQIVELRVLAHIGGYERAFRHHLETLRTDELERPAHELRCDPAARELRRHLGMHKGDHAALEAIEGDRRVTLDGEVEPALRRIVANGVGHGRPPAE